MLCLLKKKGRSQVSWKTLRFPIWCWLYPLIISSLLHSVAMSMPLRRPCVWLRYDYYSETMMSVELDYSTCTQMRSERQRTFDLENALICSWRTPMFDRDYHVYYYMGLMRNCQHDFLFFNSANRNKQPSFCALHYISSLPADFCRMLTVILFYLAGFPRKQTGKNLYLIGLLTLTPLWIGNPVVTQT